MALYGTVQFKMLFLFGVASVILLAGGTLPVHAAPGDVKSTVEINDLYGLENNDWFGHSVVNLGDLDGDGVVDIAVGAAGDDAGGYNRGTIHVMFLDGADISPSKDHPSK